MGDTEEVLQLAAEQYKREKDEMEKRHSSVHALRNALYRANKEFDIKVSTLKEKCFEDGESVIAVEAEDLVVIHYLESLVRSNSVVSSFEVVWNNGFYTIRIITDITLKVPPQPEQTTLDHE